VIGIEVVVVVLSAGVEVVALVGVVVVVVAVVVVGDAVVVVEELDGDEVGEDDGGDDAGEWGRRRLRRCGSEDAVLVSNNPLVVETVPIINKHTDKTKMAVSSN
jgi:hypothetical protein